MTGWKPIPLNRPLVGEELLAVGFVGAGATLIPLSVMPTEADFGEAVGEELVVHAPGAVLNTTAAASTGFSAADKIACVSSGDGGSGSATGVLGAACPNETVRVGVAWVGVTGLSGDPAEETQAG
jgi:hypothetical protein